MAVSVIFVASNVVALAHAGPDEQSLVGGLFNTAMQVGGGLGLVIMGVVAAGRTQAGAGELAGYQAAFWTAVSLAGLGLAIAALFARRARSATGDPA